MKVWGIADLHLSFAAAFDPNQREQAFLLKPMEVFGEAWRDWYNKIYDAWCGSVAADDAVLLAGDNSWAMNLDEAAFDLGFLGLLPGHIYLCKGNHDYWWQGIGKLKTSLPANVTALQHDCAAVGGKAVCATRGWLLPDNPEWHEAVDRPVYRRELLRLEMALQKGRQSGLPTVAMLHFPPFTACDAPSEVIELLKAYRVQTCLYGHLHGKQDDKPLCFERDGIMFYNLSCDRLDFKPLLLWED